MLLSDAAPKLTGVRATDRAHEEALLAAIESALPELLRPGGALVLKLMEGPEAQAVEQRLRARFAGARSLRPDASRKGTTERYRIGTGFRGPNEEKALMAGRPFRVLGLQQIAVGGPDKLALRRLWIDLLGLTLEGEFRSERENVDEDIAVAGVGPHRVEVDLMQPIDPNGKPKVHDPALNHVGSGSTTSPRRCRGSRAQGVRFTPGGIRKGAAGHDVCFIHPKNGGEGVLIELVQAPREVIEALRPAPRLMAVATCGARELRELRVRRFRTRGAPARAGGAGVRAIVRGVPRARNGRVRSRSISAADPATPQSCSRARPTARAVSGSTRRRPSRSRDPPCLPRCEFVCHDVLAAPYPAGPADTIYARFLVTHLADPQAAITVFASQLAPRGRLLLEEVERIESDGEAFRRYLGLVAAVLASQVSRSTWARAWRRSLRVIRAAVQRVRELTVDPRDAAGMFSLNWETLREHAAVAARTTASERDALAEALAALRDGGARRPRSPGGCARWSSRCEAVAIRVHALLAALCWLGCGVSSNDTPAPRPTTPSRARAWCASSSSRAASATRACSRRWAACRATSSCPRRARVRLRGRPAADRRGPDDLAALHRRGDERGGRGSRATSACSRWARARATRPPCSRRSRARSTRSSSSPRSPRARKRDLARLGYTNVHTRTGDGYRGWPEAAPFDAIVVTAAPDHVPPALLEQLAPGGRLVIPVGGSGDQELVALHEDASAASSAGG